MHSLSIFENVFITHSLQKFENGMGYFICDSNKHRRGQLSCHGEMGLGKMGPQSSMCQQLTTELGLQTGITLI